MDERHISARKLSLSAGLGPGTVSKMIRKNSEPHIETMIKICAVFDMRLSEFLEEIEKVNQDFYA